MKREGLDPAVSGDDRLIRQIAEGDPSALGALYDQHARALYGLAVRILSDAGDAEEVVQDVFVHVWRNAGRYDLARASVTGWLLMMTRSRAIDRVRARQARPGTGPASSPDELPLISDIGPGPDATLIAEESVAQLAAALRELPEPMHAAIDLAYFEGLSQSAIAARLGEPLGTVKTRMRTALIKLRAALRPAERT